jgi:LysM repeat protein
MAAVSLEMGFAEAHRALGQVLAKKGLYREAVRHFDVALGTDPGNVELAMERNEADVSSRNPSEVRKKSRLKTWMIGAAGFIIGLSIFPISRSLVKDPASSPTRNILASRIKAALVGNASLADSVLQVGQSQEGLLITGEVPSLLHKNLAVEIARNQAQGTSVDCEGIQVAPPSQEPRKTQSFFMYTVKAGDSLGTIAVKFYGQERMWRRIFEANQDRLSTPNAISPGQSLSIPMDRNEDSVAPNKR